MAEFRLNCPGCGAEYVLPQDAIPVAGREVECNRCDHVWHARRPVIHAGPLDLASFTTGNGDGDTAAPLPLPPASKRLSPDILDILRDEVEHERRQREAEANPAPPKPEPAKAVLPDLSDNDWPATTVTLPAEPARKKPRVIPDFAQKSPSVIRHLPARAPIPAPKPQVLQAQPAPEQVIQPAAPAAVAQPPRDGYRTGFALSLLVAACCIGLYVATPKLAAQDAPLSGQLTQMRAGVDQARLWLADQVSRPDS
ncbi:MJ0042-type zinc finger domain-containing protein [Paracoccus sp. JM45]|uniref:MJ0042-type zinc finger domain-containing protein n=1 Tax=Paracoccus sp. JM45 TaxID=2283626 RepID=UPI0016041B2F|nr:MJ0042-type zinc finger domain-containing protein [Paracoccus sp. JM45]